MTEAGKLNDVHGNEIKIGIIEMAKQRPFWTLSTFPTYGFRVFWAEIGVKKRQKFPFLRIFARFLVTFARF
ncbi:MAG: hypothetical protein K9M75_01270 [Phycisphaerae bacterium]|nr:hypothetical protein [Phycisphaerae bacterium]